MCIHLKIIIWFIFQANRNCIAIASSHDVQELDVSGILATQIYTWVDDDVEVETKGYPFTLFLNGDIVVWMTISTELYPDYLGYNP